MTLQTYFAEILSELRGTLSAVDGGTVATLVAAILDADRVFIAGAGRSGLVMRGFAMRLMHLGLDVYVVSDATTPAIAANDLLLIGSGSGSTASLQAMAVKAKSIGAELALITILEQSAIADMSDTVLTLPAPTPKIKGETGFISIQPMGSLFEQSMLLTADAMILILMDRMNVDATTMFSNHANLE